LTHQNTPSELPALTFSNKLNRGMLDSDETIINRLNMCIVLMAGLSILLTWRWIRRMLLMLWLRCPDRILGLEWIVKFNRFCSFMMSNVGDDINCFEAFLWGYPSREEFFQGA
jgi:hypothetical protein